jgi:hypothetical protein
MTTTEAVRAVVADLPRSYEVLVRDRVKFRVGQIVYLAFSHDEQMMGFAFPKMRELVLSAWRMVVPKRVAAEHLDQ